MVYQNYSTTYEKNEIQEPLLLRKTYDKLEQIVYS